MVKLIPPGRSLKFYAYLSWAISGAIVIAGCLFIFFTSAAFEYSSEMRATEKDLNVKANTVARALVGEVLIGTRGAVDVVASNLKKDLGLSSVAIFHGSPRCIEKQGDLSCTEIEKKMMSRYQRLPSMDEISYAVISTPAPDFWSAARIHSFLSSVIPLALMFAIGLWLQRYVLHRYFLKPIQTLVDTSTGATEPHAHWPEEIKDISNRLYRSFETRDEEMFSQIARGVIHDLRTLIHSPLTAVDLVKEATGEKRIKRLESLYTVSDQQLLKMKEIIDNTLDGSRDVSINKNSSSIGKTIAGSLKTLEPLILQTGVSIHNQSSDEVLPFDSVQVERALTNIIKNGIEACQESTQKTVSITTEYEKQKITISVEDSGAGLKIPTSKLFRPLKSTKVHGSGLGLIITRKIIEAHGGSLTVASSKSLGGAKFTLTLPTNVEARV